VSSLKELRIGTRGSQLALWQANAVSARIAQSGGPPCRLVIIKTSGDRLQDAPLSEVGGKRLFVKEIEDALLRNEVDLAVHSSKDMPALLPPGLTIAGVLPREDPHDVVVLSGNRDWSSASLDSLVAGLGAAPSIGTGSVRRIAQLKRVFPGARFSPIRGNLDTRLRKLDSEDYDALILAAAGLRRLGFASRISLTLPPAICLPAPGQGIVAIEAREADTEVRSMLARIHDDESGAALEAERAVVDALGGGCQTPIGALATSIAPGNAGQQGEDVDGEIELAAAVIALDGSRAVRASGIGRRRNAAALGMEIGARLIKDGAGEILAEAQRSMESHGKHGSQATVSMRSAALSDE
jgi:hydroxymethylbilane synthase